MPDEAGGDDWITVPVAARLLGLRQQTVRALVDAGELGQIAGQTVWKRNGQVGERRSYRLRRGDVADYIEGARVKPGDLRHLYPRMPGNRYR